MILHPHSGWYHEAPQRGARGPMSRRRASQKGREKVRERVARFWATKRSEFSSTPSFREAQGSPPKADPVTGAPFLLVRFLWASKENEQKLVNEGSVKPLWVHHQRWCF